MKSLSEDTLIRLIQCGSQPAFGELLRRYRGLIRFQMTGLGTRSLEHDDLMQVATLAFHKAAFTFDPGRGGSFRSFATLAVERAAWTAIKMALRQKHRALNEAASLSQPIEGDDRVLADMLPGSMEQEPCTVLISREVFARKLDAVRRGSQLERAVAIGLADGQSYLEIADKLGRSPKTVDNAAQRMRQRLAKAA